MRMVVNKMSCLLICPGGRLHAVFRAACPCRAEGVGCTAGGPRLRTGMEGRFLSLLGSVWGVVLLAMIGGEWVSGTGMG